MRHNELLMEKVYESVASVAPITAIVLLLSITIAPLTSGALVLFLFGALLLVFGMGFFTDTEFQADGMVRAHNTIIQIFASTGIIGALTFLPMYFER